MNDRWGFEEADDEVEPGSSGPGASIEDNDESLTGHDPAGVVTIAVTDAADVISVRLANDWKDTVDPRTLHSHVLDAMNAATMQALAKRAEQVDLDGGQDAGTSSPLATSQPPQEERPITKEDAMRLIDAVSADLDQFMRRASMITNQVITAESSGAHVSVSGKQRQVVNLTIDPAWASRVRNSEIESELTDALTSFTAKSSLGDLAQGPRSSAIDELMSLVADPRSMVRRINQRR